MDQKHILAMENLHKTYSDIDDFLGEVVSYVEENEISKDVFFAWWGEIDLSNEPAPGPGREDESSFLNDMVQFADNWELYFD